MYLYGVSSWYSVFCSVFTALVAAVSRASLLLSDGESVELASGLNLVKCSRLDSGPRWLVSLPAGLVGCCCE